jgi:hypothetical protein
MVEEALRQCLHQDGWTCRVSFRRWRVCQMLCAVCRPPSGAHERSKHVRASVDATSSSTAQDHAWYPSWAMCCYVACRQMWYVEEQDLLALALQGRYVKHSANLRC